MFCFSLMEHAVLFTVRILSSSSYETRRANATALILVTKTQNISNIIFLQLVLYKRRRRAEMAFFIVAVVVPPNSAT